jgi:DNA-directed RNA polymerase specialized sigma24 family protein
MRARGCRGFRGIDLNAQGKIADRARSRHDTVPGNLICYRGEVVSQGVDYLETFYQQEPLKERIAKTLSEKPEDPWALAHRGEMALEGGDLEQAISLVEEAGDGLLSLDEALTRFAVLEPSKAELVKLRYFAGYSIDEAADLLGISRTSAKRHWAYARAWLLAELYDSDGVEKS